MATVDPRKISRNQPVLPAEPLERDRSHLRVVRPDGRRRPHIRLTPRAGVGVVVLLFLALFLVAVSHALLIQSQVKLDRLDKQVAAEQNRYEQMRSDVSDLESPNRIQNEASKIGMVPGGDPVWVTPDQQAAKGATDDSAKTKDKDTGKGQEDSPDTSYSDVKPYLGSTP